MEQDQYPENLPADFVKVNEGVPSQIGQGQINPRQTEDTAQAEEAEQVKPKQAKKVVKKGKK